MWSWPMILVIGALASHLVAANLLSYNGIRHFRGIYYDFHISVKKCLDMTCVCRYIDNRLLNLE